jgi:FAD:protein FMN transferase
MEYWTRWTVSAALMLGIVVGIVVQLASDSPVQSTRGRVLMGTLFEITAVGPDDAPLDTWIDSAFSEVIRIERLTSDYDTNSMVGLLNGLDGTVQVVGTELAELLDRSIHLTEVTHGAFDITVGAATHLWREAEINRRPPTSIEVSETADHIGPGKIVVDVSTGRVQILSGTTIDLGAIAKGYAVDAALASLIDLGVYGAMVNGGGDIATFGRSAAGDKWRIGIRHPRGDAMQYFGVVTLSDGAIATTGDYERGYEIGDTVYSHIIDPENAQPVNGPVVSATIVAKSTELADALATAVFTMGADAGLEMLTNMPGVDGLIVTRRGSELVASCTREFLESADHSRRRVEIDTTDIRLEIRADSR